jgi:integral membrane protein
VDSRALALIAYRVMAYVTGTGLIVLVCIAMPIKYLGHNNQPVAIVGALHGFLYMFYVVCTLVLAERCRWKPVYAVLVALAGTIPFVSFYAERKVTKQVRSLPPMGRRPSRPGSGRPAAGTGRPAAGTGRSAAGRSVGAPEGATDQQPDLRS